MLKDRANLIIEEIIKTNEITETTLKWAESRRDALKALTMICNSLNTAEYIGKEFILNRLNY